MSPHEKPGGQDDPLGRLLNDAVSDIEPDSRIEAIRARTSVTKESTVSPLSRPWFLGAFGAAVATAAVITAVVVLGDNDPAAQRDNEPAAPSSGLASDSPSPGESDPAQATDMPTTTNPEVTTSTSPVVPRPGSAVPVYYLGDTGAGPRLYREFHAATTDDVVMDALTAAVQGTPLDRDYRSPWPDDASVDRAGYGLAGGAPDVITVDLSGDLHDRPAGMSEDEARMAIEQLIYTAQAAVGKGRVPVQLMLKGNRTDQVLGQPASEPLANGSVLDTNSHVQLSTPNEGDAITGDTLEVSGAASSFEANVVVKLQRFEGTQVVFEEPLTAEGWMGDRLFPFSGSFDVGDVPAGTYVLTASTDDPSGGAEGPGAYVDSRVITIG